MQQHQKRASVKFTQHYTEMRAPDGSKFYIQKHGRLYYMNIAVLGRTVNYTAEKWHKIPGHCNVKDMKITPPPCVKGKGSQYRNREPERCATRSMARFLLLEANLPNQVWAYAVMASAYIGNRCCNPRNKKTPIKCFTGLKPDLCNMHQFGTVCYAYVQTKSKLDERREKFIFVGYKKCSIAYFS